MNDDGIPPPLIPDPPSQPPKGADSILIPYLLADAPRLQLDMLSRHMSLPKPHREAIREWLRNYNTRLLKWIHDNYGPEAVKAADALSRAAGQQITTNQKLAQDQAERDLFTKLEQEFKNEQ